MLRPYALKQLPKEWHALIVQAMDWRLGQEWDRLARVQEFIRFTLSEIPDEMKRPGIRSQ